MGGKIKEENSDLQIVFTDLPAKYQQNILSKEDSSTNEIQNRIQ